MPDELQKNIFSGTLNCEEILSRLVYERDVRKTPDVARQGRFRAGWLDFATRGKRYSEQTLRQLTWSNLGYRLGQQYGFLADHNIHFIYAIFADQYAPPSVASQPLQIMPDEMVSPILYREGATRQVVVNAYERNRRARTACLAHHGTRCMVCELDFGEHYGAFTQDFIHVHHLKPVSEIGVEYRVDPVTDLCPVCPNCHVVIHMTTPPRTIEQMRDLLAQNQRTGG